MMKVKKYIEKYNKFIEEPAFAEFIQVLNARPDLHPTELMNDRQLHSENSGLLMAERNETDFLTTERKISPSSTGTTLSTNEMGTEITKLRKTRSF